MLTITATCALCLIAFTLCFGDWTDSKTHERLFSVRRSIDDLNFTLQGIKEELHRIAEKNDDYE